MLTLKSAEMTMITYSALQWYELYLENMMTYEMVPKMNFKILSNYWRYYTVMTNHYSPLQQFLGYNISVSDPSIYHLYQYNLRQF